MTTGISDAASSPAQAATLAIDTTIPFTAWIDRAERAYLRGLLEATPGGNMQVAARAAGMEYETFRRRVQKRGLRVELRAVVVDA